MSTKNDYAKWMNQKQSEVRIHISPSTIESKLINEEYERQTGTTNYYDFPEIHDTIRDRYRRVITIQDITLTEAQAFAEPIRIAHPDQCVSLYAGENSFIGNTTWNDQLEMFFEYPTYTEIGKKIMEKRQTEAKAMGKIASWE